MILPKPRLFMPATTCCRIKQRRLHKKFQLVQVSFPRLLFDGQEGLRAGGIDHRDIDVLISLIDCLDHFRDIRFLAHIGIKGSRLPRPAA